jgi:hypothetical protein
MRLMVWSAIWLDAQAQRTGPPFVETNVNSSPEPVISYCQPYIVSPRRVVACLPHFKPIELRHCNSSRVGCAELSR